MIPGALALFLFGLGVWLGVNPREGVAGMYRFAFAIGCVGVAAIIDMIPLPATPKMIVKVIVGLIVLLYLLGILMGAAPYPMHFYRG